MCFDFDIRPRGLGDVHRGLPWNGFLDSVAVHVLALAVIWVGSRFLGPEPQAKSQPAFTHADIVFYTPSEYLPPLDTRRSDSAPAREADPEYSTQPIISLPPEADNRSQTIVTPPNIQLRHDVPLPNVVAPTTVCLCELQENCGNS